MVQGFIATAEKNNLTPQKLLRNLTGQAVQQLISFPTTDCLNKRLDGYEVIITLPISQTSSFFPVLTGRVIGSGTITFSGYGKTKSVTVTNNGVIK